MKTWDDLINWSLKAYRMKTFDISLDLRIKGETWNAYEATVAHREILFYCDKGSVTYFVDTYGGKHSVQLFDWERSET